MTTSFWRSFTFRLFLFPFKVFKINDINIIKNLSFESYSSHTTKDHYSISNRCCSMMRSRSWSSNFTFSILWFSTWFLIRWLGPNWWSIVTNFQEITIIKSLCWRIHTSKEVYLFTILVSNSTSRMITSLKWWLSFYM